MGAMYRLKAYFGMVPAEETEELTPTSRAADRSTAAPVFREYADDAGTTEPRTASDADRRPRRPPTPGRARRSDDYERDRRPSRPWPRSGTHPGWDRAAPPGRAGDRRGRRPGAVPAGSGGPAEPGQRARPTGSPGRITTLHPRSYNEARTIGEHYRDGTPVIMNLTEMDDADAKRLVDFAAGLAFALRGSIDKVTNKVFLLSPPTST